MQARPARARPLRLRLRVAGRPGSRGALIAPGTLRVVWATDAATLGTFPPIGDDYPFRGGPIAAIDPWGFFTRECTSFVAWRLNAGGRIFKNAAGPTAWGDADHWEDAARALGYGVGARPAVGSIAQWNANEGLARAIGHVGYVAGVNRDGSAIVEDYNGLGDYRYHLRSLRAPRYIYLRR